MKGSAKAKQTGDKILKLKPVLPDVVRCKVKARKLKTRQWADENVGGAF